MQLSVIRAKIDTDGVDISGDVVTMAAGTTHIIRTKDLPYYQQHSDAFEVVSATPALLLTDSSGNVVGLESPTDARAAARLGLGKSLIGKTAMAFGNSLTKQNAVGYPGAAYFYFNSHYHWANAFMGAPLVWSRQGSVGTVGTDPIGSGVSLWSNGIFGCGGYTSTQLLPYFDTYIGAYKPDVVFLNLIENDIPTTATAATIVANVLSIVASIVAWGGLPIVVGCGPSTAFNTSAYGIKYYDVERLLLAAQDASWVYVPISDIYLDGSSNGAQPKTTGSFANYTDGVVHPLRAAILIGDRIASTLEGLGYYGWAPLPMAAASGSQGTYTIGRNLNLSGTAGTVTAPATGYVASSYTGNANNGGATFSKQIVRGQEVQRSIASWSGSAAQPENNLYGSTYETTGYTAGSSYVQAYWDIRMDSANTETNHQSPRVQLQFQTSSGKDVYGFHSGTVSVAQDVWPSNRKARLYSPETLVPSDATGIRTLLLNRSAQSVTSLEWTFDVYGSAIVVRP